MDSANFSKIGLDEVDDVFIDLAEICSYDIRAKSQVYNLECHLWNEGLLSFVSSCPAVLDDYGMTVIRSLRCNHSLVWHSMIEGPEKYGTLLLARSVLVILLSSLFTAPWFLKAGESAAVGEC